MYTTYTQWTITQPQKQMELGYLWRWKIYFLTVLLFL